MENLSEKLKAQIIAYVEKTQPEYYFDYRDELSSEQVETIVSKGRDGLWEIENEIQEYNWDYEFELIDGAINEYTNTFEDEITDEIGEDRGVWEDDFRDWIREYVHVNMDTRQLIRNTGDKVFFLDTGEEFTGYGQSPAEFRMDRIRIKKLLGINNSKFDNKIDMMLQQASYGGQLVVYFAAGIDDFLNWIEKKPNAVEFSNASIAIIDTLNGSGDHCRLPGHSFTLPFSNENLHFEESINYNYTYQVCGMSSDWCADTVVCFKNIEQPVQVKQSSLNQIKNQDREYDQTFKAGKCTLGDKNISRHRNVIYVNNFPCGNVCQDCGQFWVD